MVSLRVSLTSFSADMPLSIITLTETNRLSTRLVCRSVDEILAFVPEELMDRAVLVIEDVEDLDWVLDPLARLLSVAPTVGADFGLLVFTLVSRSRWTPVRDPCLGSLLGGQCPPDMDEWVALKLPEGCSRAFGALVPLGFFNVVLVGNDSARTRGRNELRDGGLGGAKRW